MCECKPNCNSLTVLPLLLCVFFLSELSQIPPLILFKAKKVLSCKNFFEVVSKSSSKMFTLPTLYFAAGCKHAF